MTDQVRGPLFTQDEVDDIADALKNMGRKSVNGVSFAEVLGDLKATLDRVGTDAGVRYADTLKKDGSSVEQG